MRGTEKKAIKGLTRRRRMGEKCVLKGRGKLTMPTDKAQGSPLWKDSSFFVGEGLSAKERGRFLRISLPNRS